MEMLGILVILVFLGLFAYVVYEGCIGKRLKKDLVREMREAVISRSDRSPDKAALILPALISNTINCIEKSCKNLPKDVYESICQDLQNRVGEYVDGNVEEIFSEINSGALGSRLRVDGTFGHFDGFKNRILPVYENFLQEAKKSIESFVKDERIREKVMKSFGSNIIESNASPNVIGDFLVEVQKNMWDPNVSLFDKPLNEWQHIAGKK